MTHQWSSILKRKRAKAEYLSYTSLGLLVYAFEGQLEQETAATSSTVASPQSPFPLLNIHFKFDNLLLPLDSYFLHWKRLCLGNVRITGTCPSNDPHILYSCVYVSAYCIFACNLLWQSIIWGSFGEAISVSAGPALHLLSQDPFILPAPPLSLYALYLSPTLGRGSGREGKDTLMCWESMNEKY